MADVLTPDICVIGGGPGGIAVAVGAANAGVPVVLVEAGRMGGANLAYGAVPSKAFIAAAGLYEALRRGPAIGVTGAPLQVNFGKINEHVRAVVEAVAPNVSAERLAALGVTVIAATAQFTDRNTVAAGETTIRARRFVIATGALPAVPALPGIDTVEPMTAEAAFDATRKPSHLLVLGAGGRGLELAQAYNRLGVDATVIDEDEALTGTDRELAAPIVERLSAEGVRFRVGARIVGLSRRRGGIRVTLGDDGGEETVVDGSHLLVVKGRRPNIDVLGLDAAGIVHDPDGIRVDGKLRTANRRVYAIGDVIAGPALAARAEHEAARVLRAILYRLSSASRPGLVPEVTFTDPGLATVGLGETEAAAKRKDIRVFRHPFVDNDLSEAERTTAGMIKIVTDRGGRILGAGVVGRDAGELIAPWSIALAKGLSADDLVAAVPPYPSRAEIARRVAAAFHGPGMAPPWRRRLVDLLRRLG